MIPAPSKRTFGYPLPAAAIPYLVHPDGRHEFSQPFRDAGGNVVTWNGALAVRIRSFMPDDLAVSPKHWEAVENSLHWPAPDEPKDLTRWRFLEDAAADIWRFQPSPAWIQLRGGRVTGNKLTTVQIGTGPIVPLGLLQLVARLPRARVKVDGIVESHLQVLFNGGEAVIRPIRDLPAPRFSILMPRFDPLTREAVYR